MRRSSPEGRTFLLDYERLDRAFLSFVMASRAITSSLAPKVRLYDFVFLGFSFLETSLVSLAIDRYFFMRTWTLGS